MGNKEPKPGADGWNLNEFLLCGPASPALAVCFIMEAALQQSPAAEALFVHKAMNGIKQNCQIADKFMQNWHKNDSFLRDTKTLVSFAVLEPLKFKSKD